MGNDDKLRVLRGALSDGQDVLAVHYASENLNDAKDRPTAVACVAVANVREETSVAFSLADEPPEKPLADREIGLLTRFYRYLADYRDARIVHWNMNSSTFGFEALATRYRFLTGTDPAHQPPHHLLYDLDGLIGEAHGEQYVPHPKLYNTALLNKLGMRAFLKGSDEAKRYTDGDFGAIRNSTSAKTHIIASLLHKLVDGTLQTQTSVGAVSFAKEKLDAVSTVLELGDRFLYVKRSLSKRHAQRATLLVKDEYDAQDLFRSLLYIFFEDIRPEEWVPGYAGGASRMDFLLPDFQVAIELKHSRPSLKTKDLADELIVDRDRYKQHPGVSHLICLVFDYDGHFDGPRGIERDLSRESTTEGLSVTVKIYDR